ncbi:MULTISPECIES: copper chaperone PCu(A)C [unclassified Streptomyces]|uniref:copper chaperone PCu(A)C n=1 Tax=unclassified Streptomyces TaxID=2593676 RepID=UPI00386B3FE6
MRGRGGRLTVAGATAAALLAALAGCAATDEPQLKVSGAFIPRPVGDMASGFFTVTNSGDTADKLTSVTSDISDDITIHETKDQKMRQVDSFDIPAEGELTLDRGGNHLMFMGLKKELEEGQRVTVELRFDKTGPMKVDLPVKAASYNPTRH